jgi:hypothetical protein
MRLSELPLVGSIIARRDARIAAQVLSTYQASVIAQDEAYGCLDVPEHLLENCRIVPDRALMLAKLPKGGLWCEIGTAAGEFAEQILAVCKPDYLHLVDSWAAEHDGRYIDMEQSVINRFNGAPVKTHRGYSTKVLDTFPDSYFDVTYLDTGHGYNDTVAELELCHLKVKPDGLIAGHDYVIGNWRTHYRYGVVEAVNKFCIQNNWEFMLVTWECHRHISYVLKQT